MPKRIRAAVPPQMDAASLQQLERYANGGRAPLSRRARFYRFCLTWVASYVAAAMLVALLCMLVSAHTPPASSPVVTPQTPVVTPQTYGPPTGGFTTMPVARR